MALTLKPYNIEDRKNTVLIYSYINTNKGQAGTLHLRENEAQSLAKIKLQSICPNTSSTGSILL